MEEEEEAGMGTEGKEEEEEEEREQGTKIVAFTFPPFVDPLHAAHLVL